MATFSDDFSTRSGTSTVSSPTNISGWTLYAAAGSAAYVSASIQDDATALSGKVCRIADTGYGADLVLMTPTAIGNISSGTATEVLISMKFANFTANAGGHFSRVNPLMRSTTNNAGYYGVGVRNSSGTRGLQAWYFQSANDWDNIGSERSVTSTLAAGEWWWVRMQVTAGGSWSWKAWEGDFSSEPGSWDVSGVSQTTRTSGYVGFGGEDCTKWSPVDVQWFSVGTAGDPAPEPSGGGGTLYNRRPFDSGIFKSRMFN